VAQVLSEDKRAKIEKAVDLCAEHVVQSDEVLKLGKLIERADLPSGSARGFTKV
jgi:hypothetical protein